MNNEALVKKIAEKWIDAARMGCVDAMESAIREALFAAQPVLNQCDGCMAGYSADNEGLHIGPNGKVMMACQADKYAAPTQPAEAVPSELPQFSGDDLQLLHYNPNTDDVVDFVKDYARRAIALATPAQRRREVNESHE